MNNYGVINMISGITAIGILGLAAVVFSLIGIIHVRRSRHSLEDHLVSRNSTGAWAGAATVTASVIGAWVLFSPAETATWAGLTGVAGYALGQAAPLLALVWLGPRMRQLMPRGHSLTEFVHHRYGPSMHLLTLAIIIFYMFVFLAAEMTAIALAIRLVADIPLLVTALIVAAGTVAYTCYGGLRASIFTDRIQFLLILPLLAIVFIGAIIILGGPGHAFDRALSETPHLFSITHTAGIEFGFTLVIAILAANLFHQGFWQRVYACRDERAVRRSYLLAGLLVIPVVFISGLFGLMALNMGIAPGESSVALFTVVVRIFPPILTLIVLVLALALVMSSMDTLLNGMASTVTCDLARFRPGWKAAQLFRSARWITVLLAIPAVWIASHGYSVLYLFLIADLVCAGAMFPVFYGLYARRFTGRAALAAAVAGIVTGALYFPAPDFTPWLAIPGAGRFLISFGSAVLVSTGLSIAWHAWAIRRMNTAIFDFTLLERQVQWLGEDTHG